jgi:hypothetical protein
MRCAKTDPVQQIGPILATRPAIASTLAKFLDDGPLFARWWRPERFVAPSAARFAKMFIMNVGIDGSSPDSG